MTPADFRAIAHVIPEACLLVEVGGTILGVNPAAERLLGRSRGELEGAQLPDLVSDDAAELRRYLATAARTRGPVSGGLHLVPSAEGAEPMACTCLGGLAKRPDAEGGASLVLRLKERGASTNRFQLLNDQVDRLTTEVRRRREAEREQARLLRVEGETRAELEARTMELERATARLERNRALLEESQRSARVGSWEWDIRTGALTWSEELFRIYGLDPESEAVSFERFQEMVHPEDRASTLETIGAAVEAAGTFTFEHRIVIPDGTVRVLHARGRAMTDPSGAVVRMIGSGQDVTERKRAEERTRFLAEAGHLLTSSLDYEETLQRVVELAVPRVADWAAVDVLEEDQIRRLAIAHPDPRQLALVEELARRWPEDADHPGAATRVQLTGEPILFAEIPESLLEEQARSTEHLRLLRELGLRSGMVVPLAARGQVLGSITLVASDSGRVFDEEDLAFALELADRAALAVDNARLYKEARDASRARDDLLAIVSHDLRSPLNAVLAGASLLLDVPLPDEKREDQYRAIKRSAERMERLTRDLLDITRIEAGHLKVEPVATDARSLVEEALEGTTFVAGRTGIFLSSDIPDRLPSVRADRSRVLQVLDNILSNAIRHTPQGGRVTIGVEERGEVLRFRVTDTGTGIPPELRDHVFDRYWQAEQSDHGGAGLGLPIARGIVMAHRGQMWLEADVGSGTTFYFTLPVASDQDEDDNPAVA